MSLHRNLRVVPQTARMTVEVEEFSEVAVKQLTEAPYKVAGITSAEMSLALMAIGRGAHWMRSQTINPRLLRFSLR